jgi:murein DD-endopeptidase MepM/ murein hydrolase activator NlpD
MRLIIALCLIGLALVGISLLMAPQHKQATPAISPSATIASSTPSPSVSPTPSPSPSQAAYYYPISNYINRITNRHYGQSITATNREGLPCGAAFSGLHTGDDLEVTSDELNKEVPVYAITDGTVRQASQVSGYGGLIVIQHQLNDQTVTAYYGHINLSKTTVKTNDKVKAGQPITVLGDACSSQTDNERKHLHFAIHQGDALNVKGYVTSQADLAAWLNPKETLEGLKAQNP